MVVQAVQHGLLMLLYFTKSGNSPLYFSNLALSSPLGSIPLLSPSVHMKIEYLEEGAVY